MNKRLLEKYFPGTNWQIWIAIAHEAQRHEVILRGYFRDEAYYYFIQFIVNELFDFMRKTNMPSLTPEFIMRLLKDQDIVAHDVWDCVKFKVNRVVSGFENITSYAEFRAEMGCKYQHGYVPRDGEVKDYTEFFLTDRRNHDRL